jgi:hypothetical protein
MNITGDDDIGLFFGVVPATARREKKQKKSNAPGNQRTARDDQAEQEPPYHVFSIR